MSSKQPHRDSGSGGLAIETAGLVKTFGDNRAVDGVDLAVPAGTVYGLLGPNGAGKTTTVKMLATLLRPDGGEAHVFGHDVVRAADTVRGLVSLTGQYASVDEDLTGTENLVLLARLTGHGKKAAYSRAEQLLDAFGLGDAASRQVKNYSGGMRRRIDIAASILNTPDLLFLDEPTTGLDPRSRNQVWDIVRAVVGHGTTVLLTTQYLDEADQLAARIAVIDKGKVIAEGTKGELKASVGAGSVHVRLRHAEQRPQAEEVLRIALDAEVNLEPDPVALTARVGGGAANGRGAAEQASRALAELARTGITVDNFSLGQPSLDEVFLALTGHPSEPEPTSGQDAPQDLKEAEVSR
ncbi:ATP-binding cassette domain-containing protein [Streptomyces sp. RK9]|uniref:ATP-binding cassette domain-containing protein n=1 Tax=Streptomyces sp. RK9 TaxID=3239284 RepID=UPI00386BE6E9